MPINRRRYKHTRATFSTWLRTFKEHHCKRISVKLKEIQIGERNIHPRLPTWSATFKLEDSISINNEQEILRETESFERCTRSMPRASSKAFERKYRKKTSEKPKTSEIEKTRSKPKKVNDDSHGRPRVPFRQEKRR